MSATEELRRLLDERGVPWMCHGYENHTWWGAWHAENRASANGLFVKVEAVLTPEQAIAATLGDTDATGGRQGDAGTCRDIGGCRWFRCSACGFGIEDMYVSDEDEYPPEDQPKHCPNCGRLIVEVTE